MSDKVLSSLKYNLVVVNIFFAIAGVITLYSGIAALWRDAVYSIILVYYPGYYIPEYFTALGAIMLLIAAAGFYGAVREKRIIIAMYAAGMVGALIVQLILCITVFRLSSELSDSVRNQLPYSFTILYRYPELRYQWARIQKTYQCCGANNASEWLVPLHTQESLIVPLSCCPEGIYDFPFLCTVENAHTRGCAVPFQHYADSAIDFMWIAGAFLTLAQALIIVNVVSALWIVKIGRSEQGKS